MTDCVFCKIANGELDTQFLYEDEQLMVFKDINPKANTHLLVTPKEHIPSLMALREEHAQLMAHLMITIPHVARELGIKSFRTIINTGRESGQEIDHLHFHLLSGNIGKFGQEL